MTDRINSFIVTLERDMRDDDVETLVSAFRCFRGVVGVTANVSTPSDVVARHRAIHKVREALWKAFDDMG